MDTKFGWPSSIKVMDLHTLKEMNEKKKGKTATWLMCDGQEP